MQLKYNKSSLDTGKRFGHKYRSETIGQYLKRPIKDPESGLKIRSLKDQTLAKAASVLSVQGKSTEKFKGVAKPEEVAWVTKQNKLIDEGKLFVNPPALRSKDTVDLVNIFKSEAIGLKKSRKVKTGTRLDEIAEEIKSLLLDWERDSE